MQKDFQIKRILIPYDFSETAGACLNHAVHLASRFSAELFLLHIIETSTFPGLIAHAFSGFEKKAEESSNEKLQELAEQLTREHGLKVTILTEAGKIYKRIVHVARQAHIDLVVMGSHGDAAGSYSAGSNTVKVVQECSCPVISIHPNTPFNDFDRIALPIDDSPESRQKVNFAMEIARKFGSSVTVIGLTTSSNEDYLRKFRIKVEQVEDFLLEHGIKSDSVFRAGEDIAKNTLEAARELNASLLVIMTEQEPSLSGLLMGSYASKIVNRSTIPVMTVRPAEVDPDRITVTF